ncbi:MAG: DUF4160 domain-containing protein [Actinomycetota bacterium]
MDRDDSSAKFWISPIVLARNFGFRTHELSDIERIIARQEIFFSTEWRSNRGS